MDQQVTHSPDSHEPDGPHEEDDQPQDVGIEEGEIDQILADSFPASDAPPWTLGVTAARQTSRRNRTRRQM